LFPHIKFVDWTELWWQLQVLERQYILQPITKQWGVHGNVNTLYHEWLKCIVDEYLLNLKLKLVWSV
jgi:hypothetical protein